jgi:hypothetical protein
MFGILKYLLKTIPYINWLEFLIHIYNKAMWNVLILHIGVCSAKLYIVYIVKAKHIDGLVLKTACWHKCTHNKIHCT